MTLSIKQFFLLLIVVFAIALFLVKRISKEDIAKFYGITRPTLQNWVTFFPYGTSLSDWKKRRKFTSFEKGMMSSTWEQT
jgi:hypothetical protein